MGTPDTTTSATAEKTTDSSIQQPADTTQKSVEHDYKKRFKDTQAAYTRSQQRLKELEAELEALKAAGRPPLQIDKETAEKLEELKFSDPDTWRIEMNKLEQEANRTYNQTISEAKAKIKQESEMEYRQRVLREFQETHKNIVINDDVLAYDVPPRFTKQLENGEVTFEEFLHNVANYLKSPKVIGTNDGVLEQPDLTKVGNAEDTLPQNEDLAKKYNTLVF